MSRLVMLTGSSPGAGKSSLARELAATFDARGSSVLMISEDDVWGKRELGLDPVSRTSVLSEFSSALHEQRTPPTADALLRTFDQVRTRYLQGQTTWIQDWSWLDLASAVLSSHQSAEPMTTFAADLLDLARDLNPVVLYLRVDPEVGLQRAARERGPIWLRRHAGVSPASTIPDCDLIKGLSDRYRHQEQQRLDLLLNSSWDTRIIAAEIDQSRVISAAADALGLDGA